MGTEAIESYLKALRPKQLEEYYAAFEGKDTAHAQPKQPVATKEKHTDKESSSQGGVHHSTPDHHKHGNPFPYSSPFLIPFSSLILPFFLLQTW